MAGMNKKLRAELILGGRVDGAFQRTMRQAEMKLLGFSSVTTKAGLAITAATAPAVAFGGSAVSAFSEYDDMMRKLQAATDASAAEMVALGQAARAAGATTRFSATDGAEALYHLGLSGMGAAKAIEVLPSTMNLASAAGMSIADASQLVVDSMAALGLEVGGVDRLIDQLAQTTRSSSTNMAQLGEGILTIGATARMLKGGTVELNAALAQLANYGLKGSEGGTKLRNIILSLAAPTNTAADLMADLGASEADLAEALEGFDTGNAKAMMDELGFSAFDMRGNFKPILQIFEELDAITANMSDADRTKALATIFNKRDLAGVEALLGGTGGKLAELTEKIEHSDGVAKQFKETMDGGIGGALDELKSAYEELKIAYGDALAPGVEDIADWLSDVALTAAETDPAKLLALSKFVVALAGTGVGLVAIGGASKGIAAGLGAIGALAATPAGMFFLAAGGVGALALAIDALEKAQSQADLEEVSKLFGSVTLDVDAINALVEQAGAAYDSGVGALAAGAAQLKELIGTYQDENATMSNLLMQAFIGGKITPEQEKALFVQANELVSKGQEAIAEAWKNAQSVTEIFMANNPDQRADMDWLFDSFFGDMSAQAQKKGNELKGKLYQGMADGAIDEQEKQVIDTLLTEYNALMAKITSILGEQELAYILTGYDPSSLDMDSFIATTRAFEDERNRQREKLYDEARRYKSLTMVAGREAGWSDEEVQAKLAEIDRGADLAFLEYARKVDEYSARLLSSSAQTVLGNLSGSNAGLIDYSALAERIEREGTYRANSADWRNRDDVVQWLMNKYTPESVAYGAVYDEYADDTIALLMAPLDQAAKELYEQRVVYEKAGQEVPDAIARGIADYEKLQEITASKDLLYDWLISNFSDLNARSALYETLFGIGSESGSAVIDGINSSFGNPSTGSPPGRSGPVTVLPEDNGFASGGTVTSPTLAWVGEGGFDETIIPHQHNANSYRLLRTAAAGAGFGMGGTQITVTSSPVIHVAGGKTAEILQALEQHRRELVDMISEEMDRRKATTF